MKYKITLQGRTYEVEVERGEAMVLSEYEAAAPVPAAPAAPVPPPAPAGAPVPPPAAGETVRSPMPGNVLKILVTQGQKVSEGDVLIILEAMKMENEIVAARGGTVAQIAVQTGAVVETGTPLVVIA